MAYPRNPLQQLIPQRLAKFRDRLDGLKWGESYDLEVLGGPVNKTSTDLVAARSQEFSPVEAGEHFGGPGKTWQQRWFRFDLNAAQQEQAGNRVLFWNCQGETTLYIDGAPWSGIDVGHPYCVLPDHACTVWLDTGTYQTAIWAPSPWGEVTAAGCRFDGASVRIRNPKGWEAYWDYTCLHELVQVLLDECEWRGSSRSGHNPPLDKAPPLLRRLIEHLDRACDIFEADGLDAFARYIRELYPTLPAAVWQGKAALCGHAHLDLVWLWPEAITERKAVHSFATVMRLMERYPEFCFTQSQPVLYDAVQKSAPALRSQIDERIAQGRWEATGGFEVECDVNLPCGEALARALKYGQERFAELRPDGKPSRVVWIPDVFGYSNCLPQIMKLGGVNGFFTTKMTWSSVTRFPHNTFRWRGADGTEILTHLCPTGYNGEARASDMKNAMEGHRQSGLHNDVLLPTGYGDGAGSPTEEMCERARRFKSLAVVPKTSWTTVEKFFEGLHEVEAELPVYQGELYLEYHRGTYTTQSMFKYNYRKAEDALRTREAVRVANGQSALPREEWLRLCFAEFHDAIPGSSIQLVYQQMNPELEKIAARQMEAAQSELRDAVPETGGADELMLFNPLCMPRTVSVRLSAAEYQALDQNSRARAQEIAAENADQEKAYLLRARLPGLSRVGVREAAQPEGQWEVSGCRLDNGRVQAGFSADGQLSTLAIDGRPLALSAPAGLRIYPDNPAAYDAWDIDRYSLALGEACADKLRLRVRESGPCRAVLSGHAPIGKHSDLEINYLLEAGSPHLRIEVKVNWREDHTLLKYHFPTDYRGRHARFGAPFGSTLRPQYPGYPNEESQWEVPGSRWAVVGDDAGKDGLAVLTEAKYGFSCRDGDLGVSLLRAPTEPDPQADRGTHTIRFAVGRHREETDCRDVSTAVAAEALFSPVLKSRGAAQDAPFMLTELGTLAPAWVCPSSSGRGYIIRLHETSGGRGTAVLSLTGPVRSVCLVDFLENTLQELDTGDENVVALDYSPYQILSVRVERS